VLDDPGLLPRARHTAEIVSSSAGYVSSIMCENIGTACVLLGGGREKKEDAVDPAVGIIVHKKLGDKVSTGEALCTVHFNSADRLEMAKPLIVNSYTIGPEPPNEPMRLVHRVIGSA